MTCADVRRVLPEFLDGGPEGVFPADFEAHVKSCPACSDLISDLKLISSEARQLAASEEPAPRVWVRIAAELQAEGLIRDPAVFDPAIFDPAREPELNTQPAHTFSNFSTTALERVVAGASRGCAAGGGLLRGKP